MMTTSALSVAQLSFIIKSCIETEPKLRRVAVQGEISNFKLHYQSGHLYFSIKDDTAVVKVVMYRSDAARLRFRPQDGMAVVISGRIAVYEKGGYYQLIAERMDPVGAGALAMAYEQLRQKLAAEGLFDLQTRDALPAFPRRIGVVTSASGAAVRDILDVLARRWPLAEIIMCPVLVQGVGAAQSVAAAIRMLNERSACDVMIVGRGGGSIEDLWAFNEEPLVRAVATSEIPVISAVGHETDTTLCDFAANLRAPTPSAAAEQAAPDRAEQRSLLGNLRRRLDKSMENRITAAQALLTRYSGEQGKQSMLRYIENHMQYCDSLSERIRLSAGRQTDAAAAALSEASARLDSLSPLKVLARGYAVCEKDGAAVTGIDALRQGDFLHVRFGDGTAECEVKTTKAVEI